MAKYILYMLLGLFLLAKFAPVPNGAKGCKMARTVDLQCADTQHCFSKATPEPYQKMFSDEHSTSKTVSVHALYSISLRGISFPIVLKLTSSSLFTNFTKPLKFLHSEEKTSPLSFNINPFKFSGGYYIYILRHILI